MKFAIMDNNGIIEDFNSYEDAFNSIDRVREDNEDIKGDLKLIEILGVFN